MRMKMPSRHGPLGLGDKPYSPDDLAKRWQCSSQQIRDLVKRGELPHFRLGRLIRIPAAAVDAFERGEPREVLPPGESQGYL
jgi:excisionase family DNA binding protein